MTVEELEIIVKANIKEAISGIKQVVQEVKQAVRQSIEPTNQVLQSTRNISSATRQTFGNAKKSVEDYKNTINKTVAQQQILQRKINDLNAVLNSANVSKHFNESEVLEMRAEVEKLEKKLLRLQGIKVNINPNMDKQIKKSTQSVNKMITGVKKLALSLFGIHTIFSGVSRAMSAYSQMNEDYAKKTESIWAGIGAIVAPAVEYVVDIIRWGLAYVNAFLKALTGIDFIARANAKALNKQAKANKDANKQLSAIDGDIVNLSDEKSGSNEGSNQIELPKLNEDQLAGVTNFANKLKEVWEWINKNKELLITVGTVIATAFAGFKLLNFITELRNLKEGVEVVQNLKFWKTLGGISAILGGIVFGILAVVELLKEDSDLGKAFVFILASIGLIMAGVLLLFGAIPALITGLIVAIGFLITTLITKWEAFTVGLKYIFTSIVDWLLNKWKLLGDFIIEIYKGIGDFIVGVFTGVGNFFVGIWNGLRDGFTGAMNSIKTVFNNVWGWITDSFKTGGQIFGGFVDGVANVFKTIVNFLIRGINTIISQPFKLVNGMLNNIKGVNIMGIKPFDGLWGWSPIPVPQIPQLAEGGVATGSIFANIGEGKYNEAVIPLGNSPQFRSMKEEIAEAVSSKSGGNIDNLTIQVGAKKLYDDVIDYINAKSQRLGRSVIKVNA